MGFAASLEPDDLLVPRAVVSPVPAVDSLGDALVSLERELKNPLSAVLGYAQLLERWSERRAYSDRERHAIQMIIGQAERVRGLLNELTDVTRLDEGRFVIAREPLDLRLLIIQAVHGLGSRVSKHTITFQDDEQPVMIEGDQQSLMHMLHNLLDNAIKYSPDGGLVTLRLGREQQYICMTVADNGLGIPNEALPHVFERFYRAHTLTASYIGGLGVGLYIANAIALRHGGMISVASTLGAGSVFTVWLPLLVGPPVCTS